MAGQLPMIPTSFNIAAPLSMPTLVLNAQLRLNEVADDWL